MLHYFTVSTSAELICFLTAFFCLRKNPVFAWRTFILFLWITCATEMLGIHFRDIYLADREHARPNIWLYNILLIFQAGFISFIFQYLLSKYVNSKPIINSGLAFLTILYVCELLSHGIYVYNQKTNTIMLVLFVLYSLSYYYYLLKDDGYINLVYSGDFWWVAGVLLFYFGSTASNVFFDDLSPDRAEALRYLSSFIFKTLNIILYSCWCYSFICRKWLTKTSPS